MMPNAFTPMVTVSILHLYFGFEMTLNLRYMGQQVHVKDKPKVAGTEKLKI
jgi:hypothetical protein